MKLYVYEVKYRVSLALGKSTLDGLNSTTDPTTAQTWS